ncbi:MFS transporter [Rhodoblastus acidophilus]|uniref:MFS transporter n=1 Tax=Rhodoblastus acidophilus TaxID=1074 RepID=A0A6N8DNW5_RHOAC|nr:MFS transporter [Rhodoblastus acidophilus]MCW2273976.1 MFS family permease [Rhodoblastus acidophilus]MTV30881.1 MFS transporter [Rhodoblastus acidophilus]
MVSFSAGRNIVLFLLMRGLGAFSAQMLDVAIGWHVYARTGSALSLGLVGLAQFLPLVLLLRWSGPAADRYDRRKISALAALGQGGASLAIFLIAIFDAPIPWIYLALFALGSARAFSGPANSSLLPQIVDAAHFPRAVALSTTMFQAATIAGPALGGIFYALGSEKIFFACALLAAAAAPIAFKIVLPNAPAAIAPTGEKNALDGLRYIWSNKVLLGSISLDLFAVLFGGVTALLPIYCHDILHVGPEGLGFLRAAPAVGAIAVSVLLSVFPLRRHVGAKMFAAVAAYGVATLVFALSQNFWLSAAALASLGAFDVVSMVVRQTLSQIATPDPMRGRVSAVNFLFIGASNQLGEFESGVAAALLGAVGAALFGGVAAVVVVGVWAVLFPELRRADTFHPIEEKT